MTYLEIELDEWRQIHAIADARIGPRLRAAALRDLTRMNVTAESLFGELDGLARSVYQRAVMS